MTAEIRQLEPVALNAARDIAAELRAAVEATIAEQPKISGFAIVAWGADCVVSNAFRNGTYSPVPAALVPSFVKTVIEERILHNRIVDNIKSL